MKLTIFVVFLLLPLTGQCQNLVTALEKIESNWAEVYYSSSISKIEEYTHLLEQCKKLANQHPNRAEVFFWKAVIKATRAEHQDGLTALAEIKESRDLLLKAIAIDPKSMNGSALVTLGTLYYMAPSWPIAFGDHKKAEEYLKKGLNINPEGIDSNFYYGEFLARQNKEKIAVSYFKKAIKAKIRKDQVFADTQLQTEAINALNKLNHSYKSKSDSIVAVSPINAQPRNKN